MPAAADLASAHTRRQPYTTAYVVTTVASDVAMTGVLCVLLTASRTGVKRLVILALSLWHAARN
jgi:hypothetical protein